MAKKTAQKTKGQAVKKTARAIATKPAKKASAAKAAKKPVSVTIKSSKKFVAKPKAAKKTAPKKTSRPVTKKSSAAAKPKKPAAAKAKKAPAAAKAKKAPARAKPKKAPSAIKPKKTTTAARPKKQAPAARPKKIAPPKAKKAAPAKPKKAVTPRPKKAAVKPASRAAKAKTAGKTQAERAKQATRAQLKTAVDKKAAGRKAVPKEGAETKTAPAATAPAPPAKATPAPPSFNAQKYLDDLDRLGIKLGLTRIQKLLHALGNPEKKLKVIHIVGTNGKSSTARMLSEILSAHGVKAGAYLSPHLVSYTERFLVGGREISEKAFEKLILDVKKVAEDVNARSRSSGPLTQFEIMTAAAFLYFHQQKVGAAVIEAGLGGRYDATNVTESKVQVITNVALEHTDLLGEKIEEIVREKAAVIPEKGNVVMGALSEEALAEAMKICRRKNARVLTFGDDFSLIKGTGDRFDVWTAKSQYADLSLTLFGQYQRTNCAVAIQAAELFLRGPLDEKKLRRALPRIKIPARMEIISEKPMVILDGAHNPAGIESLLNSLESIVQGRRIICVVSILKDKNAENMLGRLLDFCDILFITENSNPRCASAQELSKLPVVKESHVQTFVARENQSALESAFKLASIRDVILVTGSLYLLADIKRRLR